MTTVYLIRHGQAGTRENYDVLSDLGREQAALLGRHLAAQGVRFSSVYAGAMNRQRLTAEIVCNSLQAEASALDIMGDERWNEISLADIYRGLSARMIAEDEEFSRDFEEMQKAVKLDPHTTRGATGRCDAAMIRAWIENRYPDYEGESWLSFRERIRMRAVDLTAEENREDTIAVFTSATPISILSGAALGISDDKLLNILGVLYNSGVTVMRPWRGELRLFTFNSAAHLPAQLVTFR